MSGSDIEILRRWSATGNADAFAELVRRYAPLVYIAALRVLRNPADAEDVAQQCFLELAQRPPAIRSTLAGWLHRLATHRAMNHLRGEKRRAERESAFEASRASADAESWEAIACEIDEAIAALKPGLREVITRRFFLGESPEEVAAALGIAERTVRHRQQQGVDAIRTSLKRKGIATTTGLAALLAANLRARAGALTLSLNTQLGKLALSGIRPVAPKAGLFAGIIGKGVAASAVVLLLGSLYVTSLRSLPEGAMTTRVAESAALPAPAIDTDLAPPLQNNATTPASDVITTDVPPAVRFGVYGPDTEPVPGAVLRGERDDSPILMTTDVQGHGSLAEIPDAVSILNAPMGAFEAHYSRTLPFLRDTPVRVKVSMRRGLTAVARIISSDGRPIAGALVLGSDSTKPVGETNADGQVILPLDGGPYTVEHPDLGTQSLKWEPEMGQASPALLQTGTLLRIQVLWQGQPVAGARLTCDSTRSGIDRATTDENGFFETSSLTRGDEVFVLASLDREGLPPVVGSTLIRVGSEPVTGCSITLEEAFGGTLTGKLLWEDGAPCAGGYVLVTRADMPMQHREVTVSDDGTFTLPLFPGANAIGAGGIEHAGLAEPEVALLSAPPEASPLHQNIVLKRRPTPAIAIKEDEEMLLRLDFGERVRPKEIMVFASQWGMGGEECWIETPTDDTLRVARETAAGKLGGVLIVDRESELAGLWKAGSTTPVIAAPLPIDRPVGEIRGTLTDQRGGVIAYGHIMFRANNWPSGYVQANQRGEFVLWPVPLNTPLLIELQSGDTLPREFSRTFTRSSDGERFEMSRPSDKISGKVLYGDGTPVARAMVLAQLVADRNVRTSFTAIQGEFQGMLTPGDWTLTADGATGLSETAVVRAPSNGTILYLPGAAPAGLSGTEELQLRIADMSKQLGLVFKMYANESKGSVLPDLSSTFGHFSPRLDLIYPEYLSDSSIFAYLAGEADTGLCYLGYDLQDEQSALAWLDAYETLGPDALDEAFTVHLEDGPLEVHRLREGIERITGRSQSEVPILWQMPTGSGETTELLWITFMDGHVEQREYPGDFPLSSDFIARVREIQSSGAE